MIRKPSFFIHHITGRGEGNNSVRSDCIFSANRLQKKTATGIKNAFFGQYLFCTGKKHTAAEKIWYNYKNFVMKF